MITICLFLSFTFFVALAFYFYFENGQNKALSIPGPKGFPILGNLPQIVAQRSTSSKAKLFSKWAEQYGPLYKMKLAANSQVLVINDPNLIKNLFGKLVATNLYKSELWEILFEGNNGLMNSDGKIWLEQRGFCIKALKEFGFGKASQMEPIILSSADDLCTSINNQLSFNDGNINLKDLLIRATANTLWSIITGETMETKISDLLEQWLEAIQVITNSGVAVVPWLRYILPEKWAGYRKYQKACKDLHIFLGRFFEDHKKCRDNGQLNEKHDLINEYFNHVENTNDPSSSFYGNGGIKHAFHSILGLMMGGSETTSSTMNWLIFYLCAYPKVQEMVKKEIDEIIGSNRAPSLEDRTRMPFTEAVIQETLRITPIAPIGQLHRLSEDIKFEGYNLPKGLLIIANIYHVNHDKSIWGDPDHFRPERFLQEENRKDLKDFVFTFQPGRRTCPGENMARDIIFLFTTTLLKNYTFKPEVGRNQQEYLEPDVAFHILPKKIPVMVTKNKDSLILTF